MSTLMPTSFEGWLAEVGNGLPGESVDWLQSERDSARDRVRQAGIPVRKQEAWRYTSVAGLLEQGFVQSAEPSTALPPQAFDQVLIPDLETHRVVMVNGRFERDLSQLGELPSGVRVEGLRDVLETDPDSAAGILTDICRNGANVFSALNTAGLDDGLVLLVDPGVALDRPIELIHLSVGREERRVFQPRHLISVGNGARVDMIERYLGIDESLYCTNTVVEIRLGNGAELDHQRIQLESSAAFHIAGLYLQQTADSRYRGVNLGLGARWARTDIRTALLESGAVCDLQGLYLAGDGQLIDYHLDVDHRAPGCTSVERFKGLVFGKGRAVFDGRVFVAKDAQKTDARMSNRNLLLSRGAEVNAKPQLEILADDVKCSHGTTVGQLDPDALFYLRARGIPLTQARRMLSMGFAGEILDQFTDQRLRETLAELVGARLELAPAD